VSEAPQPLRSSSAREVRDAARRQARSFPSGLALIFSMGVAALAIAAFVVLDYRFGQDAHRIVKLLVGAVLIGGILVQPQAGLWLLPLATPYLGWMPKLPIPGVNPLNVLVFSVFSSYALVRVMNREPIFRRGSLGTVLGVMVLVAGLSVVRGAAIPTGYTFRVVEAVWALMRCSMTFTIYFIALAMVRGERQRRAMAWAIVLGLVAEALTTIAYGRNGRGMRAMGSFGQSNELGAFLAMFTAFSAALIGGTRRWFGKVVLMGAVLVGTAGVMLSVSRGALLALAASLLYVGVRSSRVLTFVLVAAMLTAPLWIPDYMMERLTGTQVEDEAGDDSGLEGSAQLRVDTWRAILDVVTDHPLDGVGFTGLGYVLPETGDALGVEVKDSAHNTYLRFLGEMGIFGLGLFVWLLWKCWKLSTDGVKLAATRFDRQLAVGVGAATLAMAISCAFGDRFFSILITGNFWLACALVDDARLERARRAA
jgi:O-antigen ligase